VGNTRDLNTAIAAIFVQGTGINWHFFYENRLIRPFIPASEHLFIDNPCERSFDFEPEETESESSLSHFKPHLNQLLARELTCFIHRRNE
jgi:hypothetical protein